VPFAPDWLDIGARILFTLAACALLGLDRGERGRAAGMRTVCLVGLAAALSMIVADLLLATVGKTGGSFSVMDVMRLPLGVLTGMGFIGAGAILKRESGVEGLTTAATLWLATMLGIAFGAGLLLLGAVSTAVALLLLVAMKTVEKRFFQMRQGVLVLRAEKSFAPERVVASLAGSPPRLERCAWDNGSLELRYRVSWPAAEDWALPPKFLERLRQLEGVREIELRI
jgi:putative Mg2+ transporter-C (MgtC) family protein